MCDRQSFDKQNVSRFLFIIACIFGLFVLALLGGCTDRPCDSAFKAGGFAKMRLNGQRVQILVDDSCLDGTISVRLQNGQKSWFGAYELEPVKQ